MEKPMRSNRWEMLADNIRAMIDFADAEQEFLLAAKLADIEAMVSRRGYPPRSNPRQ